MPGPPFSSPEAPSRQYTATQIHEGLYVVRWTEPKGNAHVTRIEDYTNGRCMISSVVSEDFIQLHGTAVLAPESG